MLRFFSLCFFLLCSVVLSAQKPFEGRIRYKIQYVYLPDDMKGLESVLPQTCELITNGKDWRLTQSTEIDGDLVMIYLHKSDTVFSQLKVGAEKLRLAKTHPESDQNVRIVETEKTKEIAGVEVKQCFVKSFEGAAQEIWIEPHFLNLKKAFEPNSKLLPLEFETEVGGVKLKYTAALVSQEPIDETYFVLSSEFKPVSAAVYDRWLR